MAVDYREPDTVIEEIRLRINTLKDLLEEVFKQSLLINTVMAIVFIVLFILAPAYIGCLYTLIVTDILLIIGLSMLYRVNSSIVFLIDELNYIMGERITAVRARILKIVFSWILGIHVFILALLIIQHPLSLEFSGVCSPSCMITYVRSLYHVFPWQIIAIIYALSWALMLLLLYTASFQISKNMDILTFKVYGVLKLCILFNIGLFYLSPSIHILLLIVLIEVVSNILVINVREIFIEKLESIIEDTLRNEEKVRQRFYEIVG